MSKPRPRLLFLGADLSPHGGGSCVAAWALQSLCEHWETSILCASRPDFDGMNRHFGTCLRADDVKLIRLPFPLRHLHRLDPDPFSFQRHAWLLRLCRRIAHEFEVVVSCEDELDFGRPGVQYTHYPYMNRHLDVLRAAERYTTAEKIKGLLTGRYRPWMWISGMRLSGIKSNQIVANSSWTAQVLRDAYDVEPRVLYPPVRWRGKARPWSDRRNAFAVLGRLSPDKRILELVGIIERVRSRGFDVGLEIIGFEDPAAGKSYVRKIRDRLRRTGGWARLHESPDRPQLEQLVSNCRYGLHGMRDEHFGIAVAEMVCAGCIVFVHDSGGQVEIIGEQAGLRYRSDDDAVEKICRVLEDETEQVRLRHLLEEQASRFGETQFMEGFRQIVVGFAGSAQNEFHSKPGGPGGL